MKANRIGYILLIVLLMLMLFFFGRPFLAYSIVVLVIIAGIMGLMLLCDSFNIHAGLTVRRSGQFGKKLPYTLSIGSRHGLLVTRSVLVELEIYNKMFDSTTYKTLLFELNDGKNDCVINLMAGQCGEVNFKCRSIYIMDMLKLFRIKTKPFKDCSTIIYPKHLDVNVDLSDMIRGETLTEGSMQNRKGNDRSEIFDTREYQTGDDVRSIHWKLSEKTGKLIVRESSEPSHYDVVLIPDFAHYNGDEKVNIDELNTAVAMTVAVAEQLMQKGAHFCVMIPTQNGLSEIEIASINDYERMMAQAMCYRILDKAGTGLEYFLMEHKEKYFTRMVIVSAGRYRQNLAGLENHMGITIINTVKDRQEMFIDSHEGFEIVEIPAEAEETDKFHIIC